MIDVGELVTRQLTIRDVDGVLTDATVAATTTKPDGTAGPSPTITHPSLGVYRATWMVDTAGGWRLNWSATGTITSLEYDPYIYVQPVPSADPPPFATADQLRLLSGDDPTTLPDPRAYLILGGISGDIRSVAGWSISQEIATFTLDGPGGVDLFLPTLRLTGVASIVDSGTTLPATDYEWSATGYVRRLTGTWSTGLRTIVATVTHGWPAGQVPVALRNVCLDHAVRRLSNPDGIARSIRIDDYAETLAAGADSVVKLDDDPRVLAYTLPTAGG